MPLYDFKCEKCGITFEQITPSEVSMVPCRECAAAPAKRQLSFPGGIRANGAGGGMVLSEKQRKLVKEPLWHDPVTDRCTSAC
jgi:putative FmdB family regulatory protein